MADKYIMDGHKLIWHLDRLSAWDKGEAIAPIYIDMGITQTCNISCSYCYYAVPDNRTKNIIQTENMIRFLKECSEIGVKAIGILGDGEPMMHNGVYDIIKAGNSFGLDMAISTNGTKLDHKEVKEFLSSLSWIRFNISAATPKSYSTVMGTSEKVFDTVVRNIEYCVEVKKKYGLAATIGMQMVLVPECLGDVVEFAKLGKSLGVDYAVIKQCSENENMNLVLTKEEYFSNKDSLIEAESYSDEHYNMIVKWNKIEKFGKRTYDNCYGCEFLPQISGAGDVYPCGNFFGDQRFYIGNINTQSFRDIVFGERYRTVMNKVKTDVNVHKECGTSCRQNEINEYLYMLKTKPQHINFI